MSLLYERFDQHQRTVQRPVTVTWRSERSRAAETIDERVNFNDFKNYFIYFYISFHLNGNDTAIFRFVRKETILNSRRCFR